MSSKWADSDIAYLTGLFDGEGCICGSNSIFRKISGKQYKITYIRISIVNTNYDVIKWLHTTFGGSTYNERRERTKKYKHSYDWIMTSSLSRVLLPLMLEYSIIKKEQIKLAMEFTNLVDLHKTNMKPLTVEQINERLIIVNKLKKLNKRGR